MLFRIGSYLAGAGLILALFGLGWDAWLHAQGQATAESEEIFTLANPGHVLFGGGLMLTVAGVLACLLDSGRSARAGKVLSGLILVTTGTVFAYGFSTPIAGHSHAPAAGLATSTSVADLAAQGLSEEEIFLVETSRQGADTHLDHGPALELNAEDVAKLADEVERARQAGERYQSIDTALAAGYIQITQDLPRIGAHFLNGTFAKDGIFDPDNPEMLIYAYKEGGWKLYGLSYLSRVIGDDKELAPEGFTGPYYVWHWHKDWCFTLTGAHDLTLDQCRAKLGVFVPRTGYMTHFWLVDNPQGLFAHDHPDLTGSDQYIVPSVTCVLRAFSKSSDRPGIC